eukprot:TRINITY_DN1062_c0_g1_i1.p1 TRINITY_DN1062_c0_g1~~TRINITY_DN1062_c0_g1_i1.p1  ORF type:complete len:1929 (+),score=827.64 TRINITY_DN1062_c0_g1_i1:180-5966(+)
MNIQSLLAEYPAFSPLPPAKPDKPPPDPNVDPFVNLTPDSQRIKISPHLLEALANLSSVGARDNSVSELQNANEFARKTLKEYMKLEFAERKSIPQAFMDLFTPENPSELNWEGVVLKLHQSFLESPELQSLMQRVLRTPPEAQNKLTNLAPKGHGALNSSIAGLRTKLNPDTATPEIPRQSGRAPKLLKTVDFVPVKPDAEKRVITSLVPVQQEQPFSQITSPREDRDEEEIAIRRAINSNIRKSADGVQMPTITVRENNPPNLSSSYKETSFPPSGMSSASATPASPVTANFKSTSGFAVTNSDRPDSAGASYRKRPSFIGSQGATPPNQSFVVDDPSIQSNIFTDRLEQLSISEAKNPQVPVGRLSESISARPTAQIGAAAAFSKVPIIDNIKSGNKTPEEKISQQQQQQFSSPLHFDEEPQVEAEPVAKSVTILDPATAYRREFYKEKNEIKNSEFTMKEDNGIFIDYFPSWFDVVVFWGAKPQGNEDAIFIPIEFLMLANSARGHYDHALQMVIIYRLKEILKNEATAISDAHKALVHTWANAKTFVIESKCYEYLLNEFQQFTQIRWTDERFNEYVTDIINTRGNGFDFNQIVVDLEAELLLLRRVKHLPSLDRVERLLVCLLGDDRANARESAVRLLNILHDGHDFQSLQALTPVIRTIGDSFVVEVDIGDATLEEGGAFLLVYGPSLSGGSKSVLSRYTPSLRGTRLRVSQLPSFKKAGYYDWRFVSVNKDGIFIPLLSRSLALSKIQGRVIVQPPIRDEIMHEVAVELQGCEWDRSGKLIRRGSFASVAKSIPELKRTFGVSTLYVMGALERAQESPTFSVVDRSAPCKWLGGQKEFDELLSTAKDNKVKILVDATSRISSKGMNRKYKNLLCKTVDSGTDSIIIHPGTDGKDFRWPDCAHLNWRKKAVWDLTVKEIRQWALRGVSGVRLDSAQSWPLILRPDLNELLRVDNDDERHYSKQEILDGEIVLPSKDEGFTYGYFGAGNNNTYPNPFFIKMTREIWREFPNFVFLAEVFWGREKEAIVSGLVPFSNGLSRSLSSIFNLGQHKDGSLSHLPQKTNVSVFYDWYQVERTSYPQNSILIYPSSSHHIHYPSSIYGSGAWVAVDLIAFLPEAPITYHGEQSGWMRNFDISAKRFVYPNIIPPSQGDLTSIRGHYEHRMLLRRNTPVLREGGMIPIFAFYKGSWHDRVFAFARFNRGQDGPSLALVAINFNDAESFFHLDLAPLKQICETGSDFIYRVVDLINPTSPPKYYTPAEFLYENDYSILPPFGSLCFGVYIQAASPTTERVLFEHSMARLNKKINLNLAPTNNMIYDLLMEGFRNVGSFEKSVKKMIQQSGPLAETLLPPFLQNILYFMSSLGEVEPKKILAYLKELNAKADADPTFGKILKQTLESNSIGPIVFVTPEIGRFSTVGGVGVMVNELTQALAALGAEVHVISPYYNYDRKGKTGYLKDEGIVYKQNVITYVGNEYLEVGVHYGFEHGVHLHFLHNFKYFTTPYQSGSPVYQLSSIVLMAKASLELCCQLRLLPSIIVSNDWYTGLIPAYGKKSGAFGNTFAGTTFFYLVHNLEEGYEGKIYPEEDLGYIHHLPTELINESYPSRNVINASLSALLCCDQWGTVSISYRNDLMRVSPLGPLLRSFPQPFAHLNGVRLHERIAILNKTAKSHEDAKEKLQLKYFGAADPTIPIFCFVGRIVLQKGIHVVLNAVHELISITKGRIQILLGGMASMKDPYAAQCAWSMQGLRKSYPKNLWADPNEFFTDGALVNYGSDFGLMPSIFEPSGVVQQEFFAAGTPVIAFKTGGLKDSVFEFNSAAGTGNGFTFESHAHSDFVQAMKRALAVFNNKDDYELLRESTKKTVLDVEKVAIGWMGEFVRLRRKIWASEESVDQYRKEIVDGTEPNFEEKKPIEHEKPAVAAQK